MSVLIPVLNEEAHIQETVMAMREQQFDGPVEFLFMDGHSHDRTRAILEELAEADPRIRVLDNPERQTAAGLNVGLRAARGSYVARMDGHTVYPSNYLATGVKRLALGDVDWVSGPQVPEGRDTWSRRVALALHSRLGIGFSRKWGRGNDALDKAAETELDTSVFAGMWRKEVLDHLGGWDDGWPVNQDSELAARLLDRGGRILLLPEMAARYVPRNSLRGLRLQYWRYGQYRAKTARRHPSSLRRSHLLVPALAVAVCSAVVAPRALASPSRAAVAAYALALGGESARATGHTPARDALALPIVLVTMHLSWGFGFLFGSVKFGLPWQAVLRAVGGGRFLRSIA